MPGITVAPTRATRSEELMVAFVCLTSERGTTVSARRLYQQYKTHYSSYRGMCAALGRLADEGYLTKQGPHRWELTTEGLEFALEVLVRRYRRNSALLAA